MALARDIYYKDPALFVKQSIVDRYVEDISFTFSVPRSALCVVSDESRKES